MNVVIKVNDETKKKMMKYYKPMFRDKEIPYVVFQAQDMDTVVTMYESGKVMFQGVTADVDAAMWGDIVEKDKKDKNIDQYYHSSAVGSDEVGTGDYFGPIVVTSALVYKNDIPKLQALRVSDSKKLTDQEIINIVPDLIKIVKYKSIVLTNEEYNSIHSTSYNLNKIKAVLHNRVLLKMINEENPQVDYIIVDEFARETRYYEYLKSEPKVQRNITFLTKAEDKNLAVACASLISRYLFLGEYKKLEEKLNTNLPKGAGHAVDDKGKQLVLEHGPEILQKIAKYNFLNTEKILKD